MRRIFPRIALLALILAIPRPSFASDEPSVEKLNKPITGVTLTTADGKPAPLADLRGKKATVVVFLSFDCPVASSYAEPLSTMAKAYTEKGVEFVGVVAGEEPDRVGKFAAEYKLAFKLFADPKLSAVEGVKATMTPEAFVLDHNGVLRYRGRIDNAYSARLKRNTQITSHDLKDAIEGVLAGKDVPTPATKAIGCPVTRRDAEPVANAKVTFHKDVAPILNANCVSCHRPGQVAPFSLMTFKQAVNWADDIKEFTHSKKMPPWKPTAGVAFHNERQMAAKDIATLAAWADAGCPEGNAKDAPPPPKFPDDEWVHGKPDLILTPDDDFHVGAAGKDIFRCFTLKTGLTEDVYVIGYEVKPGNPRVVHHTLNFWDRTGKAREVEQKEKDAKKPAAAADRGPGYSVGMGLGFVPLPQTDRPDVPPIGAMGGWAPGQQPVRLPAGTGYFLPKGADMVIQTHYHRTGKPESDRIRIGLYLAKKPVEKPYQSIVISGMSFLQSVPANDPAYKVKGSVWLGNDATVYSVMPHMHLIGRKIMITMTPPNAEPVTLVDIQDWDYNWQESYWLKTPIKAKTGTRFDVEAIYDNTSTNPNNPFNPPKTIRFGEETTNEMLFGFLGATSDEPGKLKVLKNAPKAKPAEDKPKVEDKPKAKRFEIPYKLTDTKHVLVRAKLNGKGPFNFILDTGAPAVFIPKKIAEKSGVKLGDDGWGTFDKFEIEGGLVSEKTRTRVEDLFQLEGMNGMGLAGVELHGVIGYNVLAKYRITYDFTADKLIFVPLEFDPPPIKGVGKGGGQGGLEVLGPVMKMMAGFLGITPNFETRPRGYIGIELDERKDGIYVKAVLDGSPAATAGLKAGDKLKEIAGIEIDDGGDLRRALAKKAPKDSVKFVLKRDGNDMKTTVVLGEGL